MTDALSQMCAIQEQKKDHFDSILTIRVILYVACDVLCSLVYTSIHTSIFSVIQTVLFSSAIYHDCRHMYDKQFAFYVSNLLDTVLVLSFIVLLYRSVIMNLCFSACTCNLDLVFHSTEAIYCTL